MAMLRSFNLRLVLAGTSPRLQVHSQRLSKAGFASAIALLLAVPLVGCAGGSGGALGAGSDAPQPEPPNSVSAEQKAALEDGEVTQEEYEQSFQRFQACMEGIGFPIGGGETVDGVIQYSVPVVSDDAGGTECYVHEFEFVDRAWQTKPEILEQSESSRMVKACLIRYEIEPAETHLERWEQILENNIDPASCH